MLICEDEAPRKKKRNEGDLTHLFIILARRGGGRCEKKDVDRHHHSGTRQSSSCGEKGLHRHDLTGARRKGFMRSRPAREGKEERKGAADLWSTLIFHL